MKGDHRDLVNATLGKDYAIIQADDTVQTEEQILLMLNNKTTEGGKCENKYLPQVCSEIAEYAFKKALQLPWGKHLRLR